MYSLMDILSQLHKVIRLAVSAKGLWELVMKSERMRIFHYFISIKDIIAQISVNPIVHHTHTRVRSVHLPAYLLSSLSNSSSLKS